MRVLIVDDSAFMRRVVGDMVRQLGHEVAGTAKNGQEAVELVLTLKPDAITLDIEMPVMNGLDALEIIMSKCPTPVIMLSTLTAQGADETMKALELGAMDFMTKPSSIFKVSTPENIRELGLKLEAAKMNGGKRRLLAAQSAKVIRKKPVSSAVGDQKSVLRLPPNIRTEVNHYKKLVVIGTSTGGPVALQEVISNLPAQLNAAVVVVQHMPANFTNSLAQRLNAMSDLIVKEAQHDEVLRRGTVYIAPGDKHLKIMRQSGAFVIKLNDDERVGGHRPSVDVMMNSVAECVDIPVVGVIMTGMGNDGTAGLTNLKKNGAIIISQDEATSVVFGMPGSAVRAGIVDRIVELGRIADEIKIAVEV